MMQDFIRDLLNPSWWLSVVAVSFIINIASSYAKPLFDKGISYFSITTRKLVNERRTKFEEQIQFLVANPSAVVDLRFDLLSLNLRQIFTMLLASLFAILAYSIHFLYQDTIPMTVFLYRFFRSDQEVDAFKYVLLLVSFALFTLTISYSKIAWDKKKLLNEFKKQQHSRQKAHKLIRKENDLALSSKRESRDNIEKRS